MDRVLWEDAVRAAVERDDHGQLGLLFAQAVDAWGRPRASAAWWTLLSATDGGAVTG